MNIKTITDYLEQLAPLSSQESYDNSGLIVGDSQTEVTGTLISLDCTEDVVEEAIKKGCNLIISHHPIVFKGLKKLNGKNYVERTVIKAIKNDIALYAIHTNLDNYLYGVNDKIAKTIGIQSPKILSPSHQSLLKLVTYVPLEHKEMVLNALFNAGAGQVGHYSECSYSLEGHGTFKAEEGSQPFVGEKFQRHTEKENRIEVLVSKHQKSAVVSALLGSHPYEEVAYDLIPLANTNAYEGAGMIGELESPMPVEQFFNHIKSAFKCGNIRHTDWHKKEIKRVAWCGGAGSFLLPAAKAQKADIYITGDFKYHEFFDAENQIIIADIGHFESEQYTIELIAELLSKKFTKFAPCLTETNTNPVKYF